jgi:hypothetical protein
MTTLSGESAIEAMGNSQYAKYQNDERRAFDNDMPATKKV